MTKNIVLISWDDSSKAYEAFSKFKDLDAGAIRIDSSAVVERGTDGQLKVTDGQDNVIGIGALGGTTIGLLLGILGGPLGVLLGGATGGLIGSLADVDRGDASDSVVGSAGRAIPPGRTAIVAEVEETSNDTLDDFVSQNGATLVRRSEEDVLDEIADADEAADAAAAAAEEKLHEAHKAERKAKRDEKIANLKAKLHHN
ncbi:DUF1269 domain-containing protein [Branchiibius cervicis]|uniref:DUF1269 domain-containing protein n=1 Tax=Branchiibius cervicis TaxID=908252 RepID=A0ABW2AXP5_9MICO